MTQLSDFPPDVQALAQRGWDRWFVNAEGDLRVIVASLIMEDRAGRIDTRNLTKRQADCLRFIADYQGSNGGVTPTFDEIKGALGLSAKSGVARLLDKLEDYGRIQRLPNRARAITIIANPASQQEQA